MQNAHLFVILLKLLYNLCFGSFTRHRTFARRSGLHAAVDDAAAPLREDLSASAAPHGAGRMKTCNAQPLAGVATPQNSFSKVTASRKLRKPVHFGGRCSEPGAALRRSAADAKHPNTSTSYGLTPHNGLKTCA